MRGCSMRLGRHVYRRRSREWSILAASKHSVIDVIDHCYDDVSQLKNQPDDCSDFCHMNRVGVKGSSGMWVPIQ